MKAQGREPVLPYNPAPFITDWLMDVGPTAPGGDGPVTYQELEAWSGLTGIELDAWEARTLRRLSRSFVNQRADARDPACIEPRVKADEVAIRNKVGAQFAGMLAALAKQPKLLERKD